jgi:hypothetical protein
MKTTSHIISPGLFGNDPVEENSELLKKLHEEELRKQKIRDEYFEMMNRLVEVDKQTKNQMFTFNDKIYPVLNNVI